MKRILPIILAISSSLPADSNHFVFTSHIDAVELIDKDLYANYVASLPICCVDIFVYNTITSSYLMIERMMPPAQGLLFFPGGRLFKGESFFECAVRKCKEEAGIAVKPQVIIDVYSTIFPDSVWNCQTHSINVAVLVTCAIAEDTELTLSKEHGKYAWYPLEQMPGHEYLDDVYKKVRVLLH